MKVLIISNIYPSKQLPFAGIFVKNQYEKLQTMLGNENVSIFYMRRIFTNKLGSLVKYFLATIRFLPHLFRKYDILHVHYFFPLFLHAYLYRFFHPSSKIVITFHGGDIHNFFNSKLSKNIFRRLATKIDYSISVGEGTAEEIKLKLDRANDLVMCAGIDSSVFFPREEVKIYDFIFVAKFIYRKGTDIFIEALKLMQNQSLRIAFVGSGGEYLSQINSLKSKLEIDVHLNKSQSDLSKLYATSKFFVLPSRYEPFGLVASEAMFCGTPAIVSNVGGLVEQVKHKENGLIIDELTPKGLSECLKIALAINEIEYKRLSINAKSMKQKYSLNSVCERTVKIYKELISNAV